MRALFSPPPQKIKITRKAAGSQRARRRRQKRRGKREDMASSQQFDAPFAHGLLGETAPVEAPVSASPA